MSTPPQPAGAYDVFVNKALPAGVDIAAYDCQIGGALLRALSLYGDAGIAEGAIIPGPPAFPSATVAAFAAGELRFKTAPYDRSGITLDSVSDPAAGDDPWADDGDGSLLAVHVAIERTGDLAKLHAWCLAFGGTYNQDGLGA